MTTGRRRRARHRCLKTASIESARFRGRIPTQLNSKHFMPAIKKVTEDPGSDCASNTAHTRALIDLVNEAITWETKPRCIDPARFPDPVSQPFALHLAEVELFAAVSSTANRNPGR